MYGGPETDFEILTEKIDAVRELVDYMLRQLDRQQERIDTLLDTVQHLNARLHAHDQAVSALKTQIDHIKHCGKHAKD